MRILQIIYSLSTGGAERFVVDLSNELLRTGNDVILCVLRDDEIENYGFYKPELDKRIQYINLKVSAGFNLKIILIFFRLLIRIKPQIVHCHLNLVNYLFLLTFLFPNVKFFHTIHSDPEREVSNKSEYRIRRFFYSKLKMKAVTISSETTRSFEKYYGISPFSEISNGRQKPGKSALFSVVEKEISAFRESGNTVFLHIGRYNRVKNQMMLVNVFKRLEKAGKEVVLLMIGSGFDTGEGSELKTNAGEKIFFLGEKKNVADYLLNSDAFCLSSIHEGMPISLIEALACGCIPICTPAGGIKNVISNGKNGYISQTVSEDDYYHTILSYMENKRQVRKDDLVSYFNLHFSIEGCAGKYLSAYKR